MSDELDRIEQENEADFEGHRLGESKVEPKVEPDFEGHGMGDFKVEPKLEERASE